MYLSIHPSTSNFFILVFFSLLVTLIGTLEHIMRHRGWQLATIFTGTYFNERSISSASDARDTRNSSSSILSRSGSTSSNNPNLMNYLAPRQFIADTLNLSYITSLDSNSLNYLILLVYEVIESSFSGPIIDHMLANPNPKLFGEEQSLLARLRCFAKRDQAAWMIDPDHIRYDIFK